MAVENVQSYSLFTDFDISLFSAGKHFKLYEKMGSTALEVDGKKGVYFAVWAPNAKEVSVIGSFNKWNRHVHRLLSRWDGSGIWEGFIPGVSTGDIYKYSVNAGHNKILEKGDRSIRPHDGVYFTGFYFQVDSFQYSFAFYAGVQILYLQHSCSFKILIFYPTLPSREIASSFCASTANSIGSLLSTSLQYPFTIRLMAFSSLIPRWRQ